MKEWIGEIQVTQRKFTSSSHLIKNILQLGVVFLELNKPAQALAYLDKALEYDPEHEQALLNSAILLQELNKPELRKISKERLMKLLQKDGNWRDVNDIKIILINEIFFQTEQNERVYFNLGMLAMDDRNTEEAEHFFRRAIHIKQDFRSALFNLALLLADDHRPLEAAPFLNQLVKYHSDHVKGLILLGDIYINNLKDIDAAESVSWTSIKISFMILTMKVLYSAIRESYNWIL